jgi:superfamily I DNA and RNA helicase
MWPKSNQKIFKITLLTSVLNQNIQQKVYKFQMPISYKEEKWTTKNFPSKQEAF